MSLVKRVSSKIGYSPDDVRAVIRCLTDILAQDRLEKPAISGSAWVDFFEAVVRRSEAMRKKQERNK